MIATDAVQRNAPKGVMQAASGSEGAYPRRVNDAARPHPDAPRAEIRARELGDERCRRAGWIRHRLAGADEPHRYEPPRAERAVGGERHVQDDGLAEDALEGEVVVAGEVPEAVGDQAVVVELHRRAARAAPSRAPGRRRRRRPCARTPAGCRDPRRGRSPRRPSGEARRCPRLPRGSRTRRGRPSPAARWMSRRAAARSVSEAVFGYGAKPRNAIRKPFAWMIVISPGMPRLGDPGAVERPHRVVLARLAEVEEVVVGVREHGEAGLAQSAGELGRRMEREARRRRRAAALRGRGVGQRALEVREDDSPWRADRIRPMYVPGDGGSVGVIPSIVSPTAAIVTVPCGASVVGGGAVSRSTARDGRRSRPTEPRLPTATRGRPRRRRRPDDHDRKRQGRERDSPLATAAPAGGVAAVVCAEVVQLSPIIADSDAGAAHPRRGCRRARGAGRADVDADRLRHDRAGA